MIIDLGYITMIQSVDHVSATPSTLPVCSVLAERRARFHFHHKVCAVIQIVKKAYKIVLKVFFGQNIAVLLTDFKGRFWQLTTLTFTFQKQTRAKLYLLTILEHPTDHI